MDRTPYAGPKLPQSLLDQVGGSITSHNRKQHPAPRPKAQREKSSVRPRVQQSAKSTRGSQRDQTVHEDRRSKAVGAKAVKSILKRPATIQHKEDASTSEDEANTLRSTVSRAVRSRLEEDDAEIAALERKLGIKGKQSTALEEDGLTWITDGDGNSGSATVTVKAHSREDDDWLRRKRRKIVEPAGRASAQDTENDDVLSESSDSQHDHIQNPFSEDELSDDDLGFSDDSSSDVGKSQTTRVRENPYIAPVTQDSSQPSKYVPPSLRKAQLGNTEDLSQLRRQLQGQLNRLSDTNFISILQSVEEIYAKTARQHVSSTLVELLLDLINAPSTLSETFLILYAGFATAIFKIVGPDFAASLLEHFTADILKQRNSSQSGKNVLNMIGFLSNTYVLHMIGPSIIFSYIKLFLQDFTEDNTELLLRIIRTAGTQLRSDDPTSLKDIVLILTRSAATHDEESLSVRTKFMIETINELKNNRMKTGGAASALTSEHVARMRKLLSSLNNRALRATEPLQVSLEDIQDSEKKGKWWLVGASYHDPSKLANNAASRNTEDGYESETPGHVSLHKLARSQGMNTDIRRAIFNSIMSATDYEDAHNRIAKLNLKNKQAVEVPKVLLHCAGAESAYNPYYTVVARRLCSESRLQKAFQSSLWDTLRKLDLDTHGEDLESKLSVPTIVNLARLFGTLIADNSLAISSLKTVEFAYPSPQLQSFVEVLLTTIMLRCSKQKTAEAGVRRVFLKATSAPGMITGLRLFIEQTLSTAAMANGAKERQAVKSGCQTALQTLSDAASTSVMQGDMDSDSEMSIEY